MQCWWDLNWKINEYIRDHHACNASMLCLNCQVTVFIFKLQCRHVDSNVLCLIFPDATFSWKGAILASQSPGIVSWIAMPCSKVHRCRSREGGVNHSGLRDQIYTASNSPNFISWRGESITVSCSHPASAPLINEREMQLLAPK